MDGAINSKNGLTEAQIERLATLAEEAGEVIQIVGKILRFGYESYHPERPEITNRTLLSHEILDFAYMADLMEKEGDAVLDDMAVREYALRKASSPYLPK